MGDLLILPHLLVNLFDDSCQQGLTDVYFYILDYDQTEIHSVAHTVPAVVIGRLLGVSHVLSTDPILLGLLLLLVLFNFSTLRHFKHTPGSSCVFPQPVKGLAISLKSLVPLTGEWCQKLRSRARCRHCHWWESLFLGSLSGQSVSYPMYMRISIFLRVNMCLSSQIWVYISVCNSNCHVHQFETSPLLICDLSLPKREPGSFHLPSIYLIAQLKFTCLVVFLLGKRTCPALSAGLQDLCTVSSDSSLTDNTHFKIT